MSIFKNLLLYLYLAIILNIIGCTAEETDIEPPAVFGSGVAVGDSIGQFIISEIEVFNSDADSWSGWIRFEGESEVSGRYGRHPLYPETGAVSFFPDERSVDLLPRYIDDKRGGWFSFSNEEDDPLFTAITNLSSGSARIIVSEFYYNYTSGGGENKARLQDIIQFDQDEIP
jgi:hypothetical protein